MKKIVTWLLIFSLTSVYSGVNSTSKIMRGWEYKKPQKFKIDNKKVLTKNYIRYFNFGGNQLSIASATLTVTPSMKPTNESKDLIFRLKESFRTVKWKTRKSKGRTVLEGIWHKTNRYLFFDIAVGKNSIAIFSGSAKEPYLGFVRKEMIALSNRNHFDVKAKKLVSEKESSFLCRIFSCARAQGILDSIIDAIGDNAGGQTDAGDVSIDNTDGYLNSGLGNGTLTVDGEVQVTGTIDIADSNGVISGATSQITSSIDGATGVMDTQGGAFNSNFADFNNNFSGFNTTLGDIDNSINTQGDQINNTINTQSDQINNTINTQGDQLNNTINDSVNTMQGESEAWRNELMADSEAWREESAAWRAEYSRTNDIAEKMSDPSHMAKVGFATAAGAALGSLAVNLAVTGITSAVSYIWNELIWNKTEKKIRWENFQEAIGKIEEVEKQLVDLEKAMSGLIKSLVQMAAIKSRNQLDINSNDSLMDILGNLADDKMAEAEYIKQFGVFADGLSKDQIKCKYTEANEMIREADELKDLIKFAKEHTNNQGLDRGYFCNQINNMKKKIIEGENLLNKLRIQLLAGAKQYYEHREEEIEKLMDNVDLINDEGFKEDVADADKDELKKIKKAQELMDDAQLDIFLDKCYAGEGRYGQFAHQYVADNPPPRSFNDKQMDKRRRIRSKIRSTCRKLSESYLGALAKQRGGAFKESYNQHKDLIKNELARNEAKLIGYNITQMMKEKEEVRKWFEDKRLESVCYMDLYTMDKKKKNLCRKLSPRVIKNFEAVKNAESFWMAACKEDYDQILQITNQEPDFDAVIHGFNEDK